MWENADFFQTDVKNPFIPMNPFGEYQLKNWLLDTYLLSQIWFHFLVYNMFLDWFEYKPDMEIILHLAPILTTC